MADALSLAEWDVERIEGDLYFHGWRNVSPLAATNERETP
jgi:hypothetical protein